MKTVRTKVDNINCNFNVLYTLASVFTLMMSVERMLIKMQMNIPKPIKVNGNIKFERLY